MSDADLAMMLQFFKALADETRLRIVALLAGREQSVEEIAAALSLRPPTVSHHLQRLRDLDLVEMRPEGTTHYYALRLGHLVQMNRDLLTAERVRSLASMEGGQAWEQKVLRDFFSGEELKEIPASRKKRLVVLRWLADRFSFGERYPESEVNEILGRHHPDFATLRRELIGNGLMQREGSVYWRVPASQEEN